RIPKHLLVHLPPPQSHSPAIQLPNTPARLHLPPLPHHIHPHIPDRPPDRHRHLPLQSLQPLPILHRPLTASHHRLRRPILVHKRRIRQQFPLPLPQHFRSQLLSSYHDHMPPLSYPLPPLHILQSLQMRRRHLEQQSSSSSSFFPLSSPLKHPLPQLPHQPLILFQQLHPLPYHPRRHHRRHRRIKTQPRPY